MPVAHTTSTTTASVRFAAALCEISGSFLIFRLVGNVTQRSAFRTCSVAPTTPIPPQPHVLGVTAATTF